MSSSSQMSRFHGCSSVAARMPASTARLEVDRRVVDQQVDPDRAAVRDLVEGAVELVVGQPDPVEPALGGVVGAVVAVRGDVDEVAGLASTRGPSRRRPGRLGARICSSAVGLLDAGLDLLGPQAVDVPELLVVGSSTKRRLAAASKLVPVVVQRGVDVDRDPHGRVDTVVRAVPTRRQQLRGAIENGLLRLARRARYADGDDPTWMPVDWPAMNRRGTSTGRRST